MIISYAITVCNEYIELKRLLETLFKYKRPQDEIVVLIDTPNGTQEVRNVIEKYIKIPNFKYIIGYSLCGDFAKFKNILKSKCVGDIIYQLDSDEIISKEIINTLSSISEINNVDLIKVPRINIVKGIGLSHIQNWGWNVSKIENMIEEKDFNLDNPKDLDEYNLLKKYNLIIEEIYIP